MNGLKLEPVGIDGCAVGVQSKSSDPILKPWRVAVSSQHMKQALDGLRRRCQGGHGHVPCAGREAARSAFYPEQLCNAIHDGLDAHESALAMPATGTHVKPFEALVPGSMSVPGECLRPAGSCIGAAGDSIGAISLNICAGNQNPLTLCSAAVKVFKLEAGNRNPLTLSSAAVTVWEPVARTRNPLALSSAAVTVCELAGNQPSMDVVDKPRFKHKEASVPGTLLIGPGIDDPCWQLFCLEHGIDLVLAAWSFADRPEVLHADGPEKTEMKVTGLNVILVSSAFGAHL